MCRTGDKLEHRLHLLLVTNLSRHYFVEIVNTAQIVHMWGQCLNIFSEVKNYDINISDKNPYMQSIYSI